MRPGTPIPENAEFNDPLWISRFHDLANTMVMLGAKPKLITHYTGLNPKAISERYKRLTGQDAPPGRLPQKHPKHYAIPHHRGGLAWNLQSAAFASIYLKLEAAIGVPTNRGWMLTTAYQTYSRLTDPLIQSLPKVDRITINNGYDLTNHLGQGHYRKHAPLALKDCPSCLTSHLVVTEAELDSQGCPMCAIQKRFTMLVENAERITALRNANAA